MRRLAVTVTSAVAIATLAGTSLGSASGQQQAAAPGDPYGSVWNILPPGSSGNVTALDLIEVGLGLTATGTTPKNFGDQLEMYDALTKKAPSALKRADVDSLYKRENFTPEQVVSTATPKPGVTIQRDQFGVPYITGTTYPNVAFGAGYAAVGGPDVPDGRAPAHRRSTDGGVPR